MKTIGPLVSGQVSRSLSSPLLRVNVQVCGVVSLGPHEMVSLFAGGEAEAFIAYVLRGAVTVEAGGETGALVANETLVATDVGRLVITAADEGAVVFVVAIGPPPGSTTLRMTLGSIQGEVSVMVH